MQQRLKQPCILQLKFSSDTTATQTTLYSSTVSGIQMDETKLSRYKLDVGEQLLPGIPDEITINEISLRLPWKSFHALSRVSHSWQQAIQSYQLYDARVRSKSTETLLVFNHQPNGVNTIALYSIEEDRSYHLPPIPGHSRGIPWFCGCIFLDGKLYVLGGSQYSTSQRRLDDGLSGDEVYVFDVAGQKQWKHCASMNDRRGEFGCGVMDSKIYVFGGRNEDGPVRGAEVYDPREDSWSPITPMPSLGFNAKVTAVGDELFVHCGDFYDSDFVWTGLGDRLFDYEHYGFNPYTGDHIHIASFAEVYHPGKDEWRNLKIFTSEPYRMGGTMMVADGKFHKWDHFGTHVYDFQANSWKLLQRKIPPRLSVGPKGRKGRSYAYASVLVNEVVFTAGEYVNEGGPGSGTFVICKSVGFEVGKTELRWQRLKCCVSYTNAVPHFMHSIEL